MASWSQVERLDEVMSGEERSSEVREFWGGEVR